ncbi:Amt family ammonium transporter [Methanofollis sp. W23]|uniref:ammonium transporter n=1 Tax=Methanofollis sp. W23 TaxID=2817849 RepID=UPI001AE9D029|nr:ammonium transporter [Methanofollis sp. W23]MBP2146180.1 Amt family ammonium transporter [Methanofollis sp. W23]
MHIGHRLLPILVLACLGLSAAPVMAADPGGTTTLEENPGAVLDFIWVLICGFMVMFMQAGFTMVETGFTRAKNAANIMMKNLMDFSVGALSYWAVGFAIMYGTMEGMNWLFGWSGFFLIGDAYDVTTIQSWFFQMVFAATAATIVSGSVSERCKFSTYAIASAVITAVIYPLYGHWLWGGGWLADLGALDFAGSGVVHALGGWLALAAAFLLGPRIGKYAKDGTPRAIPGHSVTLGILGVFVLWFGWYGFNCGSTLAADTLRISVIAANTTLAAAAALVTAMLFTWAWHGKPDVSMSGNAAIGGLVAITAGCAWVSPQVSVLIGIIAGALVVLGVWFLDWKLRIDDPVGAISVHGINGTWGLLALGLFADGTYGGVTGLLYGNAGFFAVQALSVAVNFAWAFGTGLLLFGLLKRVVGIRVPAAEELQGLDLGEHGMSAYPNFVPTEPAMEVER